MPIVIVKMLQREHTTDDQKEQVIAGITRLMTDVLGKKPESTQVVIEEVPLQNWGSGGQSIATRDRALQKAPHTQPDTTPDKPV